MSNTKEELSAEQIVEIKANAKVSKLLLHHKKNPMHFNLLKATVSKIEGLSGVEVNVPSEYKSNKVND